MYLETSKLLKGKTFALFDFLNFHQNKMTIKTIMLAVRCIQTSSLSKKRNREILFTQLWYREHHPAESISHRVVWTTMIRLGLHHTEHGCNVSKLNSTWLGKNTNLKTLLFILSNLHFDICELFIRQNSSGSTLPSSWWPMVSNSSCLPCF